MRGRSIFYLVAALGGVFVSVNGAPGENPVEAMVFVIADQHSAYERTAQLVATIDRIRSEHPALPSAILIDGDTFENGNVIARRSSGAVEFAMFAALAKRAPTILNLGNHEPEFYDLAETVHRVEATGVKVVSNIANRATGQPFAAPVEKITLGNEAITIVGVTTDHLATYRTAVRPSLDLANPVVWAKENFPRLLNSQSVSIVLSHAGLNADRAMLSLVPDGTLFAGAHDHLRFIHPMGRGVYFHSGSWNEYLSVATLQRDESGLPAWKVEQIQISTDGPADTELAKVIRETRKKYLTAEDTEVVGGFSESRAPAQIAQWVTQQLAMSAQVDAAFVGNTTFGAGLPAGSINRLQFDACIRFDGAIYVAEVDGTRLRQLMANANQGLDVPFEKRSGEFLIASGPASIDPLKHYRVVTTDWGARNSQNYFGLPAIEWRELPGPRFKARIIERLHERE